MKRIRVAAAAMSLALAAGGCSDDPEPEFAPPEPSASTSNAESEEPTDVPTSEPPEALSPEDTVRAWVEARNVAVRTGRTDEVYALSTENCETCRNSVEPVETVYDNGGRYETSGWRVQNVATTPKFGNNGEVVAAVIFEAGRTFPDAESAPVSYNEEKHIMLFRLGGSPPNLRVQFVGYIP